MLRRSFRNNINVAEEIKGASKEGAPVRAGALCRGYFNSLYPLHMQYGLLNFQSIRILLQDILYYLTQAFQIQNKNCVSTPGSGKNFSSRKYPGTLCDPPNLIFSGHCGNFSREHSGPAVKRTAYFHLVHRSRTTVLLHVLHLMPSCLNK